MPVHFFLRNSSSIYFKCLFGSLLGTFSAYYHRNHFHNRACGIIGVLSNDNNAEKSCLKGLELMAQSDFVDFATIDANNSFAFSKIEQNDEMCFEQLKKIIPTKHKASKIGLLQTIWTACGSNFYKTNSTLQTDEENRIVVAHIGHINNYEEMKNELNYQYHINLESNSCTDIIMQYVCLYMKSKTQMSLFDALTKTLQKIDGSWGVIAFDRENPNSMVISKNKQNFLLGLNQETIYVASEIKSIHSQCSEIYPLRNNETMELNLDTILKLKESDEFYQTSACFPRNIFPKSPYIHFYEEEIYEQADSAYKCLGYGSRLSHNYGEDDDACKIDELNPFLKQIMNIKNLILLGSGTSYHVVLYAVKSFKHLETFETVQALNLEEFELIDLPLENAGVIIAVEFAESYGLIQTINKIKEKGILVIGVVNQVSNCLMSCFDVMIDINCGKEEMAVQTKSFICEVIVLELMNIWFSNHFFPEKKKMIKSDYKDSLRQLPIYINECLSSQKATIKKLAQTLVFETSLLILGKGPLYSIAKEASLKFMQLAKIHSEAIYAGEMKHGPLALINPNIYNSTKIFFLIFEDEFKLDMELALSEIKLRGAYTIVFTDCLHLLNMNFIDEYFEVPKLQYLSSLLAVIPFQMLAYEIGLIKNINPDMLPFSFK